MPGRRWLWPARRGEEKREKKREEKKKEEERGGGGGGYWWCSDDDRAGQGRERRGRREEKEKKKENKKKERRLRWRSSGLPERRQRRAHGLWSGLGCLGSGTGHSCARAHGLVEIGYEKEMKLGGESNGEEKKKRKKGEGSSLVERGGKGDPLQAAAVY